MKFFGALIIAVLSLFFSSHLLASGINSRDQKVTPNHFRALSAVDLGVVDEPTLNSDFFSVEIETWRHPELQNLVDQSLAAILKTQYGLTILKRILHCDLHQINVHFGLNDSMAKDLATACERFIDQQVTYPEIKSSPLEVLKKTTLSNYGNQGRKYTIILTNEDHWQFDSWTNSVQNMTTFIIGVNDVRSQISFSRLAKILAHETAIYFDSKFWVSSSTFKRFASTRAFLRKYKIKDADSLFMSLDNPLIAYPLAVARAFSVERRIINELLEMGVLKDRQISAEIDAYLPLDCRDLCMLNRLKLNSKSLEILTLPLLAFSPQYRSLLYSRRNANSYSKKIKFASQPSDLFSLLIESPRLFFERYKDANPISIFFDQTWQTTPMYRHDELQKLFSEELTPSDFENIAQQSELVRNKDHLINFFAKPELSGHNIRLSSGPRPRIIVGGGLQ